MRSDILINPLLITREYKDPTQEALTTFMSGVYLHGKLEDKMGYDCCGIVDKDPRQLPDGIYPCKVLGHDEPATMYFWISRNYGALRGLVVLDSDKEAVNYATKMYNEKKEHL